MAVIRRTRTAPAQSAAPAPRIVRTPVAKQAPPAPSAEPDERESGSYKTDYAAVIKRYEDKVKNPMTAIRARCIQCANGQVSEVKLCATQTCALWPFRMGDNPFNKKTRERMEREAAGEEE